MSEPTQPGLQAGFDRQLVRIAHRSVRYLVVEVKAPRIEAVPERPSPPLNLGLVIDASGSMGERDGHASQNLSRLEAAKRAAAEVVAQLGDADCLSLVSFSNDARNHLAALPLTAEGRRQAALAIAELATRGSTNLHEGWLAGAEQVALHMETHPACQNRVLLLSDGYANQGVVDPHALAEVASGLRVRGISTSTVGVGEGYSSEQIEGIAAHGGGMLHHAQTPEEIAEVVLAELRDMQATCIENLEVEVSCDVQADAGGSAETRIEVVGLVGREQEQGACAVMGSLIGGAVRRVVFRIFVPPGPAGGTLRFLIQARWRVPGSKELQKAQVQVELHRATDEVVLPEVTVQNVGLEAARVWQAEVVRQAVLLNGQGKYREAVRYVEKQLKYFRRFCSRLAAGADLVTGLEETMERIARPMREGARKEIATAMFKSPRAAFDARAGARRDWRGHLRD